MQQTIHPTAVVDPGAQLGDGVELGPYAIVGAGVRIGDGSKVGAHASLQGPLEMGARNVVHPFASLGGPPQDRRYAGEPTRLVIGDDNVFREFCTINRGTVQGGGYTSVGNGNLVMSYAHIAHDCHVGNSVVLANGATLAGHVLVEDGVILGGLVAIHQWTRLGRLSFICGGAMVERDVLPFCRAAGDRARLYGINSVGLQRAGFDAAAMRRLKTVYRTLFRSGHKLAAAVELLRTGTLGEGPESREIVAFIEGSQRGLCGASSQGAGSVQGVDLEGAGVRRPALPELADSQEDDLDDDADTRASGVR